MGATDGEESGDRQIVDWHPGFVPLQSPDAQVVTFPPEGDVTVADDRG